MSGRGTRDDGRGSIALGTPINNPHQSYGVKEFKSLGVKEWSAVTDRTLQGAISRG